MPLPGYIQGIPPDSPAGVGVILTDESRKPYATLRADTVHVNNKAVLRARMHSDIPIRLMAIVSDSQNIKTLVIDNIEVSVPCDLKAGAFQVDIFLTSATSSPAQASTVPTEP